MRTSALVRSVCGLALLLAACGGGTPATPTPPTTPPAPIVTTPEIDARLAAADRKDGTEDKVVHRCAGCALGMDGKAEFAMQVGGYQMHFCKQGCLVRYQKDALGELGKLDVK